MSELLQEEFERLFLDFLEERERRLGSEPGGLHAYYSRRLELRRAFNPGEIATAALLLRHLPRYDFYIEIGPGFGQLAAWLAIQGLVIAAIERDTSRFAGLEALRELVATRWPGASARMRSISDAFPCPLPGFVPARTLIITTNLVFGASFEVEQRIIEGIGGFAGALIDTTRFCRDRAESAEWSELDRRFAAAGLSAQQQVWPADIENDSVERIMWYSNPQTGVAPQR